MDENTHSNGHKPEHDDIPVSVNPYRDAVSGTRPREIVEFELNTDPYANMLPRVGSVARSTSGEEEDTGRSRNPVLVVVSVLLVVILVLPVMVEVFARLIH